MSNPCVQCGNTLLWWPSRAGVRVCQVCWPDPLQALEALGQALAQRCGAVAEAVRSQSTTAATTHRGTGCDAWGSGERVPGTASLGGTLDNWHTGGCTGDPNS